MADQEERKVVWSAADAEAWLRRALTEVHGNAAAEVPQEVFVRVTPKLGGGKDAAEPQKLLPPGRHDRGYTP